MTTSTALPALRGTGTIRLRMKIMKHNLTILTALLLAPVAAIFTGADFRAANAAEADEAPGAKRLATPAHQWQPLELAFTAEKDCADPFDFVRTKFSGEFLGPDGEHLEVNGFWDGERSWKIRFTPTHAGEWSYATRFTDVADRGLHQQHGVLRAESPTAGNPLRQHGGFLKVSANRRYLTFTDGTPFFWLGDTWWNVPSAAVPFANFQRMVDTRAAQGYTVFQAHGYEPLFPNAKGRGIGAFEATRTPDAETLRYWREVDKYFAYAAEKGMVGVVGFSTGNHLDRLKFNELQRLWYYYLARYGAYPITFLITQEYNEKPDERAEQISRLLALGQFIKDSDPWKRAMTAHSWTHTHERFQAAGQPWHDFTMLQGGHSLGVYERWRKFYHALWERMPAKAFVEAEANYEGFSNGTRTSDATLIRCTAYTAIQTGSFGFTYGGQGLDDGISDRAKPGMTAKWGPVLTWEEGLSLPGGAQLSHLRKCYESLEWWKLEPVAAAVTPAADILVKADGDKTLLLYFLSQGKVSEGTVLSGVSNGSRFRAEWFDPRTGNQIEPALRLISTRDGLILPQRPDNDDWLLILRREP
jgi:hypothetical protein